MSDLDLGSSVPTVVDETGTELVLKTEKPVDVVKPEEAAAKAQVIVPINPKIQQVADAFVTEIASMDVTSPQFADKVSSIANMGDREIKATSEMSNRMLDRPAVQNSKDAPQNKVGKTLVDLRNTVTDLDPKRADLKGAKKVLKWMPGGSKIDNYFAKYKSAQGHINDIVTALETGQDELMKDNASIKVERDNMRMAMAKLSEYNTLTEAMDAAVVAKIDEMRMSGKNEEASALESDVLFAVRQRRQDIMTQMAVAAQGYLALGLIVKNNEELIRGVNRAKSTTLAALRTAVIVSQALAQQKLVLDQLTSVNTTTSNLIESTSEQLKTQGAAINQQAAAATIDVDKLQKAFDNVFATMDAIDSYRSAATDSMAQTINTLQAQIQRAEPYMERARKQQLESNENNPQLPGGGY